MLRSQWEDQLNTRNAVARLLSGRTIASELDPSNTRKVYAEAVNLIARNGSKTLKDEKVRRPDC